MADNAKPAAPSGAKQAPPKGPTDKVKSFLGWAFAISIGIHALTLPFFHFQRGEAVKEKVEKVVVSKKIIVKPPTPPPPTPTPPPPTPPPKSTPPPVKQTNPPPQPKLKLNVVKQTNSNNNGPSEQHYVAPAQGNENGAPQGQGTPPAAAAATGIPATPAPTPSPTPKPQCAVPNADATVTQKAEADYPDIAKQQGAQGTTTVKVQLDAGGSLVGTSIYKSSGFNSLDQAALSAARSSRYAPETVNCVKTAGFYLFVVDFTGE